MSWKAVHRVASRQYGVVTHQQLCEAGLSRQQIRTAIANGVLLPPVVGSGRRVYRLVGSQTTREQILSGGVLAAGEPALTCHSAANWLWGLELPLDFQAELLVPRALRHLRLPGIKLHTTTLLDDRDVAVRRGIPVTSVARTLIDCSARVSDVELATALRRAERRRLLTPAELDAAWERVHRTTGWDRTLATDRVIAEATMTPRSDSEQELRVHRLIEAAGGFPPHTLGIKVEIGGRIFVIDGGFEDYYVGWEYDGAHHQLAKYFHLDRRRSSIITARTPWRLLPFTSKSDDWFILESLDAALRQAGWRGRAA